MVSGEFVSQSELYAAVPDFTPEPYAWGTYAANPDVHFFLCAFVDMDEATLPDPQKFARGLARLHTTTTSPTGKYGFHVATLQGLAPQFVDWTDTWEEFFSRSLQRLVENEEKAQGPDPAMQHLVEGTLNKVIPRLLRPLETGGRKIRPCLVHSDLWDGNVATELDTDKPVIFDSACIYAHNEYELAPLRPVRHRMRREYIEAYMREVPPSEPGEDYDDRNALYCLSRLAALDFSFATVIWHEYAATMSSLSTPQKAPATEPVPYSTFTSSLKKLLAPILTITMFASPLTATIYLPLLPRLAIKYHTSLQAINLTITLYVICQAISPLVFSTSSDTLGRRPILLLTYTLFTVASLGLAINKHSFTALLLLRGLQSLGASAVLAVAYGVIADVCPPAERGTMQGFAVGGANLATCLGPVIGGWVALESGNSAWIFWGLVIFGGGVILLVGTALPETARSVVGNGSVEVASWQRPWWSLLRERRTQCGKVKRSKEGGEAVIRKGMTWVFKMGNPWTCLRILFWKDTALVLWMSSAPYAVWYCIQTSISLTYKITYGFNELDTGLTYLPGATGVIIGAYLNGKLMDRNYRITATSIGHSIDKVSGDNIDNFPIEQARAKGSYHLLTVYSCALAAYGWVVSFHVHQSVPLILQFVLGMLCTSFQQTFSALLVDIFPSNPSTAAAAGNIVKCVLSAVAVAVLLPLQEAFGIGWVFAILTALSGGGGFAAAIAMRKKGMEWRRARIAKPESISGHTDGDGKSAV
ncbi:MAG: hypothetical protein Q9170_002574 [Blastenia crenularia]